MGRLGAGGMGEVYRARDTRLRRDVAVKVIRSSLATPEYIRRLDLEARTAGSLNHPNILAVFDVGTEGEVPYVVSELLEGESLRQRMDRGPIPYRKALEYGIQVASALAAAHEKGIRHRDVKPANVFITTDGRIKLLDFGLAKMEAAHTGDPDDSTASPASRPGVARGTVGYMSPEQVLGESLDHRADIFALGIVLYEMLTAKRAFQRASPVESMSAALNEEPVDPVVANPALPPPAAVAVRRCLEKNKEARFQSARDLAFHLTHLVQATMGAQAPALGRRLGTRNLLLAGLALAAVAGTTWVARGSLAARSEPVYQQLTFDRGRIGGARFARAEAAIVYSQALGVAVPEVRLVMSGSPESRPLGHREADVLATRPGELALSIHRRYIGGERFSGTLATVPLNGGTPKELMLDVEDGDWDPSGTDFAVARSTGFGSDSWLEYPAGTRLYKASGSIHSVRVSPDGQRVAFVEDPAGLGTGGFVRVAHRDGTSKVLTRKWVSARGLAWSPRGDEVWFTAAEARANRALRAVDLKGKERLVAESPGSLTLWDAPPTDACCSPGTTRGGRSSGCRRARPSNATFRRSTTPAWPRCRRMAVSFCSATASASTSAQRTALLPSSWDSRTCSPTTSLPTAASSWPPAPPRTSSSCCPRAPAKRSRCPRTASPPTTGRSGSPTATASSSMPGCRSRSRPPPTDQAPVVRHGSRGDGAAAGDSSRHVGAGDLARRHPAGGTRRRARESPFRP